MKSSLEQSSARTISMNFGAIMSTNSRGLMPNFAAVCWIF